MAKYSIRERLFSLEGSIESTRFTSCGSTKCCRVQGRIGSKRGCVWETTGDMHVLVFTSVRCFFRFGAGITVVSMRKRLCVVQSSSSLGVKRLLSAGNGDSRSLAVKIISSGDRRIEFWQMVSMPSFLGGMEH